MRRSSESAERDEDEDDPEADDVEDDEDDAADDVEDDEDDAADDVEDDVGDGDVETVLVVEVRRGGSDDEREPDWSAKLLMRIMTATTATTLRMVQPRQPN